MKYSNTYGSLQLEPIGPFKAVNTIRGVDLPDDIKFSMDTAEKIALITDNRGIQLCFESFKKVYVIIHQGPSLAAVARIVNMEFDEKINPAQEIDRLAKCQPSFVL
jgi:hypothetical protein